MLFGFAQWLSRLKIRVIVNHRAERYTLLVSLQKLDKENDKKPLYTDALWGMAVIYEIREKYEETIKCYDRILEVMDKEFGFTEGAPVDEVNAEKQRVLELMRH